MEKTEIIFDQTSPNVGPDCICTLCGQPILEGMPIRLWADDAKYEARFHESCGVQVINNADSCVFVSDEGEQLETGLE